MQITLTLHAGPNHRSIVTKADINRNIEAIDRVIKDKPLAKDYISLLDTKTILEGIRNELPEE